MTVSFFHRTPSSLYSIERVFQTVQSGMPPEVKIQNVYSRFRRGIPGLIFNILEARSRQSDVNHITGDVHYLALGLDPKRTILTVHDCGPLHRLTGWRREFVRLFWFEWPTRRVAAVTTISEQTKAELLKFTSCPESKISVIPDPIPADYQPHLKSHLNSPPQLLQIGTRRNKNLENVVRALRAIACHLTIVGRLTTEQILLLKSNGVRYTAVSDLSDAAMLETYHQTDIVLFCSTYEGFGMPIIEANAIGRAVVASDIEPIRSIANGSACLVDPQSSDSVRLGILKLLEDGEYRAELIRSGFSNRTRFAMLSIVQAYLALYNSVAGPAL